MNYLKVFGIVTLFLILMSSVSAVPDYTGDASAFYKFKGASSEAEALLDLSPNNMDLTNYGATWSSGGGFDFDGTNDYLEATTTGDVVLDMESEDFVVCAWVEFDVQLSSNNYYVHKRSTTGWFLGPNVQDKVTFYADAGLQFVRENADSLTTGTKYLQCAVLDRSDTAGNKVYIDAVSKTLANNVASTSSITDTAAFQIAQDYSSNYFNGKITALYVWKGATIADDFDSTAMSYIYSQGDEWNPFASSSTNFTVTITDEWDNSAINNVNLTLSNGTVYTNSTGNVIRTDIPSNSTSLFNYSISSNNYFTSNFSNVNVSSNVANSLIQNYVVFNASTILNESVDYTYYQGVDTIPSSGFLELNFTNSFGSPTLVNISLPPLCYNSTGGLSISSVTDIDTVISCTTVLGSSIELYNIGLGTVNDIDNFYAQNVTYSVNGTSGVAFPLSNGNYVVSATASGFYTGTKTFNVTNLENTTITVNGLFNHLLTLNVKDIVNNDTINNFSGVITNDFYAQAFSTTNGSILLPTMSLETSLITLNPILGYASNNLSFNITPNSSNASTYIHYVYQNNSVYITLLNDDLSPFTQEVNITLYSDNITYIFSTSSGFIYEDELLQGTYLVSTQTANFSSLQQIITLNDGESQNLQFVFVSDLEPVRITIIDNLGKLVDQTTITATYILNGTSVVHSVEHTDLSGSALINLNPDQLYTITVAKDGYDTFIGELRPTLTEYTITVFQSGADIIQSNIDGVLLNYDFINYNSTTQNGTLYYDINSPQGLLQYWGYNYTISGVPTTYNQTDPNGGNINVNITVPNTTSIFEVTYFFKVIGVSEPYSFTISYYLLSTPAVNGLFTDDWAISDKAKPVVVMFIIAAMIGVGLGVSREPVLPTIMGMAGVGICMVIGALSIVAGTVTLIVGVVLLVSEVSTL